MARYAHTIQDRVRDNTPEAINAQTDQRVIDIVRRYGNHSVEEITQRLRTLEKEWDIERTLEVNASTAALAGLVLGTFVNWKWLLFSGVVAGFLLQHGTQGWCPPLPVFRAMGVRTRQEIDEEMYALKTLRGDFDSLTTASTPGEIIRSFRK